MKIFLKHAENFLENILMLYCNIFLKFLKSLMINYF